MIDGGQERVEVRRGPRFGGRGDQNQRPPRADQAQLQGAVPTPRRGADDELGLPAALAKPIDQSLADALGAFQITLRKHNHPNPSTRQGVAVEVGLIWIIIIRAGC
jgi:hypothetical protein